MSAEERQRADRVGRVSNPVLPERWGTNEDGKREFVPYPYVPVSECLLALCGRECTYSETVGIILIVNKVNRRTKGGNSPKPEGVVLFYRLDGEPFGLSREKFLDAIHAADRLGILKVKKRDGYSFLAWPSDTWHDAGKVAFEPVAAVRRTWKSEAPKLSGKTGRSDGRTVEKNDNPPSGKTGNLRAFSLDVGSSYVGDDPQGENDMSYRPKRGLLAAPEPDTPEAEYDYDPALDFGAPDDPEPAGVAVLKTAEPAGRCEPGPVAAGAEPTEVADLDGMTIKTATTPGQFARALLLKNGIDPKPGLVNEVAKAVEEIGGLNAAYAYAVGRGGMSTGMSAYSTFIKRAHEVRASERAASA